MDTHPDLSVVVLGYKEGSHLRALIPQMTAEINRHTSSWEIILVANYHQHDKTDETPRVALELSRIDPRITAVTLEKQGMMGWDARSGLTQAKGKFIALIDGDGQNPIEDLGRTYDLIRAENLDLALVFRQTRQDGVLRSAISFLYNLLFRLFFPGLAIHDVNAKPKVFARPFFNRLDLRSNDWFLDAEIMIQARRLGGRIKEISTQFHPRRSRPSFVKPRHVIEFLVNLTKARAKEFFLPKNSR